MARVFTQIGNHYIETEVDSYFGVLVTIIMRTIGGLLGIYLFIPIMGIIAFACGGITLEQWHNVLYQFSIVVPQLIYSFVAT